MTEFSGGFDTADPWHGNIQDEQVGLDVLRYHEYGLPVVGCSDHFELGLQQTAQAIEELLMIVCQHDAGPVPFLNVAHYINTMFSMSHRPQVDY